MTDLNGVEFLVLVGLVALAGCGALWARAHNRFVRQRQHVDESRRDVDVELRRRHDLVPRLVEVVQAYAAHERGVLTALTREREAVSGQLSVTARAYPALRADRLFADLQHQLAATEDRLAAARRVHTANVRAYNTRVQSLPTTLVARVGGFRLLPPPGVGGDDGRL